MEQKIKRLNKHRLNLDDVSKKQSQELNTALRNLDSLMTKLNKEKSNYMRDAINGNT